MRFIDPDHPFYRRAWVRWAITLFTLGWATLEFSMGEPGWGILFGAVGAVAAYKLLIVGPSDK
ncbi:hypothetical protein GCM10011452_34850 [Gemmobacter lanyuensis]|uniref:DUF3329 domain-containing protein n=1 Tax=Gemmobacter lanyuensis TaxID=1054497 RepID=A0A918J484_9RHOB|nr:DUF3329 domain-containing protein [Gemmobacter lanyuensis]GGW43603.1 hypothetical protein GCM10011452_34850 [Gemmobacter lanyuensis]